jgi:predicted CopG family antitoxin
MKSMARDNRGSDTVKSLSLRRKKLEKYFGILSKEEAEELEREIKEMRKRSDESINRKLSNY